VITVTAPGALEGSGGATTASMATTGHHARRLSTLVSHVAETADASAASLVSGLATVALVGNVCAKLRPDVAAAVDRASQSLLMVTMNKFGIGDAEARRKAFWEGSSMDRTQWASQKEDTVPDENLGLEMVLQVARAAFITHGAETLAAVGRSAPDPMVHRMDGSTCRLVTDLAKPGRPLVLNFGSCT
jgi:hypothetical protein